MSWPLSVSTWGCPVVSEIGERDLGGSASEADGADQQVEAVLLGGEDMLDPGPHPAAGSVAAGDVGRHRVAPGLGPLELRGEATPIEEVEMDLRAIGGVGPDAAGGIVGVEQVDTPINRVVLGFGGDERLGRSTVPGVVGLW